MIGQEFRSTILDLSSECTGVASGCNGGISSSVHSNEASSGTRRKLLELSKESTFAWLRYRVTFYEIGTSTIVIHFVVPPPDINRKCGGTCGRFWPASGNFLAISWFIPDCQVIL
jgi:hypothetical protein